jgi:hypothetical protein
LFLINQAYLKITTNTYQLIINYHDFHEKIEKLASHMKLNTKSPFLNKSILNLASTKIVVLRLYWPTPQVNDRVIWSTHLLT